MTTAAENRHIDRVAGIGCIIPGCCSPANIHHPRFCVGMSQRASNFLVVPLCKYHHQDGPFGHAIHNGHQEFEKNYMSEPEMLAEVIRRLAR